MYKSYKLGEICEIHSGKTPDFENEKYWCQHTTELENCHCVPWYQGKDIVKQVLRPEKYITSLAVKENNQPLTTNNSLLFFALECLPFFSGKANVSCYGGGPSVSILEPNLDLVIPEYLYYLILSKREELKGLRSGSVQKFLTKSELKRSLISFPSLQEQEKILQKFQIVYNTLFQSEVIYNDFLLRLMKKYLELGDLLFLKYKDNTIKIKDHFQLVRGKTPPTKNPEYYQNGTIKWINSGVLTNLYFLTDDTPASKLVTEKAAKECQLTYAQPNTVLISIIRISEFDKIAWVQKGDFSLGTGICNFVNKQESGQKEKNATLFFALRSLDLSSYSIGSMFPSIQTSALMNMKINWVSDPTKQKIFFTILNSKLAKIKDLHRKIKDLHRKIKDLLLLKYFGKKQK